MPSYHFGGSDRKNSVYAEESGSFIPGLCHESGGFRGTLSGEYDPGGGQKNAGSGKKQHFSFGSSMKADESFPVLTEKKEIFGETFFRELQKLSRAGGHFRLYEELKNELGECFHLWNQMKRQELYKLLQYLWLTEKNWQKVSTESLEEGADFLCRWYHQPELETPPGLRLPEKSHRSMEVLRNYLKNQAENFMEQAFDRETERTRQCQEKPWYPAFAETSDVRRLKQGIEEIAGQEKRKVQLKLRRVT